MAADTKHIDRLVLLSFNARYGAAPSQDVELRDAMNAHLIAIISTDAYPLTNGSPRIVENQKTCDQRLLAPEMAASKMY